MSRKTLLKEYNKKKQDIAKRLRDFNQFMGLDGKEIFSELSFCLFTPGSKALNGAKAVEGLKKEGLLFKGKRSSVAKRLKGLVRFHNNKASYLVAARASFRNGDGLDVKKRLDTDNIFNTREWLVKNIKGLGYKEASHFLRNIGLGKDIAILDTHILKNLKAYGIIDKIPTTISRGRYIDIEHRMRDFASEIGIPMDALDLLFWSGQTGFIFK
jgi:N-glycosylase/DNA lyase